MVAAAACDDGPQPTATEAVHPALEKAVATLRNTSSFGFVERRSESIGGISLEFGGTGFEATGNYQSPDRFTKRALVSEFPVQPAIPARSINVGEERYLIDPATGEWMLFHDDLGLGQIYRESLFRNPVDLFSAILAEGEPHEYQSIITLGSRAAYCSTADAVSASSTAVSAKPYLVVRTLQGSAFPDLRTLFPQI